MYEEIGDSIPFKTESEFNERKFQFILDYCLADRRGGDGRLDLHYAHNQEELVQIAGGLYDKALEQVQ